MLTADSTLADALAQYRANCSYEESGDVAEAAAFVSACRFLIGQRPLSARKGPEGMTYESLSKELHDAKRWLAARSASRRKTVVHVSFSNFRR